MEVISDAKMHAKEEIDEGKVIIPNSLML